MSSLETYDPGAPGKKGALFGLPHDENEAEVVIYPIPWDVTTSYHAGTANGPAAILEASGQLDLEIPDKVPPWKRGIFMRQIDEETLNRSKSLRQKVSNYLDHVEAGGEPSDFNDLVVEVNQSSTALKDRIYRDTSLLIDENKKVGLLGGDHSCPLGYLEALSTVHSDFGILQIDAHMDLRKAYEGFTHSHASIMYNALNLQSVKKLVQVGIRDFCEEEKAVSDKLDKVSTYYDSFLKKCLFTGMYWIELCEKIVNDLPKYVYVSFDIDGLEPSLCSGTGTPVPGGLSFDQAIFLLNTVKESGREIIGFDLCEVAPLDGDNDWNANVGARVLYHLCSMV